MGKQGKGGAVANAAKSEQEGKRVLGVHSGKGNAKSKGTTPPQGGQGAKGKDVFASVDSFHGVGGGKNNDSSIFLEEEPSQLLFDAIDRAYEDALCGGSLFVGESLMSPGLNAGGCSVLDYVGSEELGSRPHNSSIEQQSLQPIIEKQPTSPSVSASASSPRTDHFGPSKIFSDQSAFAGSTLLAGGMLGDSVGM